MSLKNCFPLALHSGYLFFLYLACIGIYSRDITSYGSCPDDSFYRSLFFLQREQNLGQSVYMSYTTGQSLFIYFVFLLKHLKSFFGSLASLLKSHQNACQMVIFSRRFSWECLPQGDRTLITYQHLSVKWMLFLNNLLNVLAMPYKGRWKMNQVQVPEEDDDLVIIYLDRRP